MSNAASSAVFEASPAPPWFQASLAQPVEAATVAVDGTDIAYRAWGDVSDPVIVLVHGGAAHAHWWDAHAPLLAEHHRVIAIDLSGHGDSGWRAKYNPEQWAREVVAVAEAAGGAHRPVIVGHSMGGFVTIITAARYGRQLAGAIVLDAPVTRPDPESSEGREGRMFRAPKLYPDLSTAMKHFHLVPPQPCDNVWLVEHVGLHSLRQVDDAWTWKFDPAMFSMREGPLVPSDFADDLAHAACRVAIINGANSAIVDERARRDMSELLGASPAGSAGVPFVEIPEAQHHLILDQPLAVVAAIRAVLASWTPVGTPPADVIAS